MGWVRNDSSGPYFEEELFLSLEGMVFVQRLVDLLVIRRFQLISTRYRGEIQVFRLSYPEVPRYVDIYMEGDASGGWSVVASFEDVSAISGVLRQGAELRFYRTSGPDEKTSPERALRGIEYVFAEV